MQEYKIAVAPDGEATFIYSDDLAHLLTQGAAKIERVSHVEPSPNGAGWVADMSPVGGPALAPTRLREDALAAEVAWLDEKLF